MHILVVNDDGPPSVASPYIAPFVATLRQAGHTVSVILPSENNSGMGKAYNYGKTLYPRRYSPPPVEGRQSDNSWILVNGSPASCVQLGLFHLFKDLPPVDVVISGPNYGPNITSVYNLACGTLGGALEAALCGKKAISLCFAFGGQAVGHAVSGDDGTSGKGFITTVCRNTVRLIEKLLDTWQDTVDVYHINVPRPSDPSRCPRVVWATAARSFLSSPCIFRSTNSNTGLETTGRGDELPSVKWAPRHADIQKTYAGAPPGTDAWALEQGFIGVLPVQAFMREVPGLYGDLSIDLGA